VTVIVTVIVPVSGLYALQTATNDNARFLVAVKMISQTLLAPIDAARTLSLGPSNRHSYNTHGMNSFCDV